MLFDFPILITLALICWTAACVVLGATLFFRFGTALYNDLLRERA